jgi:hypothetical protein
MVFSFEFGPALVFWLSVFIVYMTMPQEHGNPKRRPSYYILVSMQRRFHRLSQAPSNSLLLQDKGVEEPPMAIVEEEIPVDLIIILSASLMYIVLDPHDLPCTVHSTPGATGVSD